MKDEIKNDSDKKLESNKDEKVTFNIKEGNEKKEISKHQFDKNEGTNDNLSKSGNGKKVSEKDFEKQHFSNKLNMSDKKIGEGSIDNDKNNIDWNKKTVDSKLKESDKSNHIRPEDFGKNANLDKDNNKNFDDNTKIYEIKESREDLEKGLNQVQDRKTSENNIDWNEKTLSSRLNDSDKSSDINPEDFGKNTNLDKDNNEIKESKADLERRLEQIQGRKSSEDYDRLSAAEKAANGREETELKEKLKSYEKSEEVQSEEIKAEEPKESKEDLERRLEQIQERKSSEDYDRLLAAEKAANDREETELKEKLKSYENQEVQPELNESDKLKNVFEKFEQENWDKLTIEEKEKTINEFSEYQCEILNLKEEPKIEYYFSDYKGDFGGYNPNDNTIRININNIENAEETIDTIAHEHRHAYQYEKALEPQSEEDIKFRESFENYISPDEDYVAYKEQLVEKDAEEYAKLFRDALNGNESEEGVRKINDFLIENSQSVDNKLNSYQQKNNELDVEFSKVIKDTTSVSEDTGKVKDTNDGVDNVFEDSKTFEVTDEIRDKLKTEKDSAFFWSGCSQFDEDGNVIDSGDKVAAKIAKSRGGVTLETTVSDKEIDMPEWDFDNPSSIKAWKDVSAAYADQVSGDTRVVVRSKLRDGNIWENVELPKLMKNENVSKITTIDPDTMKETVIFERDSDNNITTSINNTLSKSGKWDEIIESLKINNSIKTITITDSSGNISTIFRRWE